MAHEIETFISTQKEWHHSLTQHPTAIAPMTAQEALVLAKLDWVVEKRPVYYATSKGAQTIEDTFAVVRTSDEKAFGTVKKDYKTFQPKQLLDMMEQLAQNTGVFRFQTAGAISGGRMVFALGAFIKTYDVMKGDEWRNYLYGTIDHSGQEAVRIFPTSTRVVCKNTHTQAMRSADETKMFRITHIGDMAVKIDEAQRLLGLAVQQLRQEMDGMKQLAKIVMNERVATRFIERLIPLPDPSKAKNMLEEQVLEAKRDREKEKHTRLRELHDGGISARAFPLQRGTAYGWFNAVTEYTNHDVARSDKSLGGSLRALATGTTGKLNNQALKLLRSDQLLAA